MGSYPKTAFQKIARFNTLIGNNNAATIAGLKAQFACITEEFEELGIALESYEDACDAQQVADAEVAFQEMRDGIADVLVTVYGLAHRAGIDADRDLEIVNISNMSKFIHSEGEDEEAFYQTLALEQLNIGSDKGLATSVQETAPGIFAITSAKDQTGKDGKFYPAGKLLKPSTYAEPDWQANLVCHTPAQGYFLVEGCDAAVIRAERNILEGREANDHGFTGGFHDTILEAMAAAKAEPFIVDAGRIHIRDTAVVSAGFGLGVTFDEAKAASMDDVCDKAPDGWVCTREHGHDGACAALPVPEQDITEIEAANRRIDEVERRLEMVSRAIDNNAQVLANLCAKVND